MCLVRRLSSGRLPVTYGIPPTSSLYFSLTSRGSLGSGFKARRNPETPYRPVHGRDKRPRRGLEPLGIPPLEDRLLVVLCTITEVWVWFPSVVIN